MMAEPEQRTSPVSEELDRLCAELEVGDLRADYAASVAEMSAFELRYGLSSEGFYERYLAGSLEPTEDFRRWAARYQMYLKLHPELEADMLLAMGRADQPLADC